MAAGGIDSSGVAQGNLISGNFIGTDVSGTKPLGNGTGVVIENGSVYNTIGGSVPAARNVISGNDSAGIDFQGAATSSNLVSGNDIGIDASGKTALSDGTGVLIESGVTGNTIGGTAVGAGNLISGNQITGVDIFGTSILVLGNDIGTDPTGLTAFANGIGVRIESGASNNTIGGSITGAGNVISGNQVAGVDIAGGSSNFVLGNLIGTDLTGSLPISNGTGVLIVLSAASNTIGGTLVASANVISGNRVAGVDISGMYTAGNLVTGNDIGTNSSSSSLVGNGTGVLIQQGASGNFIGAGNVISGNQVAGVDISGAGTIIGSDANVVSGNYIGTNISGSGPLGNGTGVLIEQDARFNTIGASNVISANRLAGVDLESGPGYNSVVGDFIGTNAAGESAVGNLIGVLIQQANNNFIGGGTGESNVISGNLSTGIDISGSETGLNSLGGNLVGTDSTGQTAIGNRIGLLIEFGASGVMVSSNVFSGNSDAGIEIAGASTTGNSIVVNQVGTNPAGTKAIGNRIGLLIEQSTQNFIAGNTISGNTAAGIDIADAVSNTVVGNLIGSGPSGTHALANGTGVLIEQSSSLNVIGGGGPGDGNVISGNNIGVQIDQSSSQNTIGGGSASQGNTISGNVATGIDIAGMGTSQNQVLGNQILGAGSSGGIGVLIEQGATNNTIGAINPLEPDGTIGALLGNVVSGNADSGIDIRGVDTSGNSVIGNLIGTDPAGNVAISNRTGVLLERGASGNVIGGTDPGARNIISGNSNSGVDITGADTDANSVIGNYIGTNEAGTAALANPFGVVVEEGAANNAIGGADFDMANLISGNTISGISLSTGATGNQILSNLIGTDASGESAVGNDVGLSIDSSSNNIVGAAGAGNVISGNTGSGISITAGANGNQILGNLIGTDGTAKHNSATASGSRSIHPRTMSLAQPGAGNVISANASIGVQISNTVATNNFVQGNLIGTDTLVLGCSVPQIRRLGFPSASSSTIRPRTKSAERCPARVTSFRDSVWPSTSRPSMRRATRFKAT